MVIFRYERREQAINKNFINALYVFNIVIQSIISLLSPAALAFLIGWLFVSKVGAPTWIYAPLIVLGVIVGFISMVKFATNASEGLERLERQREQSAAEKSKKEKDKKE